MILAIEGPDFSGKTSLFNALKKHIPRATFVDRTPFNSKLQKYMEHVEVMQEFLWQKLYDPTKLYVTDRSFCVSSEVYSAYFCRPLLFNPSPWLSHIRVLYLDCSAKTLQARNWASSHPDTQMDFDNVLAIYNRVLSNYDTIRLIADNADTETLVFHAMKLLKSRKIIL
jgi:thymidylate kinase